MNEWAKPLYIGYLQVLDLPQYLFPFPRTGHLKISGGPTQFLQSKFHGLLKLIFHTLSTIAFNSSAIQSCQRTLLSNTWLGTTKSMIVGCQFNFTTVFLTFGDHLPSTSLQFCLQCLHLGKDFGYQKLDTQRWEPGTAPKQNQSLTPDESISYLNLSQNFPTKTCNIFLKANFLGYKPNKA